MSGTTPSRRNGSTSVAGFVPQVAFRVHVSAVWASVGGTEQPADKSTSRVGSAARPAIIVAVKIVRLYNRDMVLLNVRLTPLDEEAVKVLKAAHVELSSLIRETLHKEAAKFRGRSKASCAALVRDVFAEYPEPIKPPPPTFDVHDRREFAAAMRKHLERKRRPAKPRP